MDKNYLQHYGILGQRWGVRRFQNADGTLTKAGKKRYDRNEQLRSSLAEKAKNNADNSARRAKKARADYNDLKKYGKYSNTYKLHLKEREEEREREYDWDQFRNNDHWMDAPDYNRSSRKFVNTLLDSFNADSDFKEFMSERYNDISKYTRDSKDWMKAHDDLMSMNITALTDRSDIRRAYNYGYIGE